MRTTLARPRARLGMLLAAAAGLAACNHVSADPAQDALRDPTCPLVINEVAAAGDPTDWFELVNVSGARLDLSRFVFTDGETGLLRAARLPPSILAPGARHVEEVTSRDDGFRLGAADALWLYRVGDRLPCDGAAWADGDSPRGGSYSRLPDGTGPFETTEPDTRGVRNR